jgi:glycogen phosphorylase
MRRDHALSGAAGGYLYVASVPADRPAADYTPRVVATHPEAQVPAETPLIRWYPN